MYAPEDSRRWVLLSSKSASASACTGRSGLQLKGRKKAPIAMGSMTSASTKKAPPQPSDDRAKSEPNG